MSTTATTATTEDQVKKTNFTCPVCMQSIVSVADGKLRLCKCGALGVDQTESTRFIGAVPIESDSFPTWWEKTKPAVIKVREQLGYNIDPNIPP